ncbi:MAG: hypothetical protein FJ306_14195, partial [Planctomycetes bacterium]|nr:hypothetical protein [Planctomycetota bacterium]
MRPSSPLPSTCPALRAASALLAGLLTLAGCGDGGKPAGGTSAQNDGQTAKDGDGDGFVGDDDCNDSDAAVNGGAVEVCDGVDNDCDGQIDEDVQDTWYADADGDGFGDAASATLGCEPPAGAVPSGTDCDDGDPQTAPDADERCDGVDNDCDGAIDEDVREVWYTDADGDGYGDAAA